MSSLRSSNMAASRRDLFVGSGALDRGGRTQGELSLRAVLPVHGAARDMAATTGDVVNRELASVTDDPVLSGSPDDPIDRFEAHAVAPTLAAALDGLAVAVAQVSGIAERRLDRMLNNVQRASALPQLRARRGIRIHDRPICRGGAGRREPPPRCSGESRRRHHVGAAGDFLTHPTVTATKLLAMIDNAEWVLGIEVLAGADAHDLLRRRDWAAGTTALLARVRAAATPHRDDRPLADHLLVGRKLVRGGLAQAW